MAEIAKIVQGNNFNVAIPLKVYILNEGEVVLEDYTPAEGDDVTIRLVGERRGYTYKPTIEGNVAHLQLSGHEVCDTYAVEVVIIGTDGTMLRSYRGDQLAIVYNVDTIIADGAVEEGELYLDSQFFIQGEKGEQGDPGQDGTDGQDGADGRGIVSITKTATAGLVDTYTITYTDGTTSTFEVTNGQSGGGEDALIVTLTYQSGTYIADKTYNEITAAIQAGRNVLVFSSVSQNYATLSRATSGKVEFSHIESVGSQMMGQFLVCHSNDTWATLSKTIQQGLVSGTTIKTINSTSLLGSGDIVVAEEFIVNVTYSGGTYTADKTPQECCMAFLDGQRVVFTNTASTPLYGDSRIFIASSVSVYNQYGQWNIYAVSGNGRSDAKVDILCYEKQINTSLTFKTITAQVNADWNASSGVAQILNKPTIPTKTSDLSNDSNFASIPYVHLDGQKHTNYTYDTLTGNGNGIPLTDGQLMLVRISGAATATGYTMYINIDQAHNYPATSNKTMAALTYNGMPTVRCGDFPIYTQLLLRFYNGMWYVVASGTLPTNLAAYATTAAMNTALATKQDVTAIVSSNFPASFAPNVLYNFGTTDSVTFGNLAAGASDVVNLYLCTWTCQTDACSVTLPQSVVIAGGESMEMKAGRTFEVTIRDNKLSFLYFD